MNQIFRIITFILLICLIPVSTIAKDSQKYTNEEFDYFVEIALGFEYGNASKVIRKWKDDIKIKIEGNPSKQDMIALFKVVTDLNRLIGDKIKIDIVNDNEDYNVSIYFGELATFNQVSAYYVPNNWGYFYVWYDSNNYIYQAQILVSTDMPTQGQRNHLIREELTGILGLAKDSWKYVDSIFYQGWTETQKYSDIDMKIIKILYMDEIKSGMNEQEVRRVFQGR